MAVQKVDIEAFLELAEEHAVIDARSPREFAHAHIPGALSVPLFTNEERKVIGTAYKQESKQRAIKIGLDYFGRKMVQMVEEVERLIASETSKTVLVHCWRGGMRSAAVAWLLDLYGFKVYTLVGGYKAYRGWALQQFEKSYNLKVIGGYTGSGKTDVLEEMRKRGQQVIDLELLANHKGSAFGNIGMPEQPSQELFENKLALELWRIQNGEPGVVANRTIEELWQDGRELNPDESEPDTTSIWVEDESQRIGLVNVPIPLFKQMRLSPVTFLNIPFEERLNYIVKGYGKGDKDKLINAIVRIKKRLGPLETKTAINYLVEDDLKESFRVLLHYYDKWYLKGLLNRDNYETAVTQVECERVDAAANSLKILTTKLKGQDV